MPEVSQAVFDYARACFQRQIEDMLDDSSHLLHLDNDEPAAEYLHRLRHLASDLGIDFDELVDASGSEFEYGRLRRIEAQGTTKTVERETVEPETFIKKVRPE
jgi:hypothetical protein